MKQKIEAKQFGEIKIKVFKDSTTNSPLFYIQPDCEELLPIVDILEDNLKFY